jgi:hypothetical protein
MDSNIKVNAERIFKILYFLRKSDIGYRDLHEKLSNYFKKNISYSIFTEYLIKLKERGWIYDRKPITRRGMQSMLSITDLGLDCYKYRVSIGDYDEYEKSEFLLLFLLGIGITYNLDHLNNEQKIIKINDIQLHQYYSSLSIEDLKDNFLNTNNRLFGYLDIKKKSSLIKIENMLNFLIKRRLLRLTDNNRYAVCPPLEQFFFKCHGLLFYLMKFFYFIFSYIRKPNARELKLFQELYGRKFCKEVRNSCYNERSFIKDLTKVMSKKSHKDKDDVLEVDIDILNKIISMETKINRYYELDTADNLKSKIEKFLENFKKIFDMIKKDSIKSIVSNYHKFIISRIIEYLFPKFVRNKIEYVMSLKIKPEKEYLILESSFPFLMYTESKEAHN